MKKVIIIANSCSGLYDFRKELIRGLKGKGYIIVALIPFDNTVDNFRKFDIKLIDIPVDRRGTNVVSDLNLFFSYIKIIKREKPDLVITYTIKPNIYGGMAARVLKIPYVANITGLGSTFQKEGILCTVITILYKVALENAKVVFFENSDNCKTMRKKRIVKKNQYCILNGAGVNLKQYSQLPYPESENPVHFLFIGRIMKEKGVDELFEAMKCLYLHNSNCVLDILGNFEEEYESLINQYEKEGWLYYHGYQSDIRPYIEYSHCFVLPSYHEGMANTNLENAASGRPLITTDIPGCREAVVENISGYLCKPKNVKSLYDSMRKFMSLSRNEREKMGDMGRKHMENHFDKKKVVKKTISMLEDI